MASDDQLWELAHEQARRFLNRFGDSFTRAECDDLVQESAVAVWQWTDEVREPGRIVAAVRTIARRKRIQALREFHRRREERPGLVIADRRRPPADHVIAGRRVPHEWLVARVRSVLAAMPSGERCILLAQQEGFCCAEIASRLGLTEVAVKVRIHRARRRVRMRIERAVKATAAFAVN
jgi:RNA polymerase sigma factor (sigma-70 family)